MKNIRKVYRYVLAMCLAFVCLASTAFAATRFSDVPEAHWGYKYIEYCADKGLIKGTNDGSTFSPGDTLSANQFATLVGRAVFPAEWITQESGDEWFTPYWRAAQNHGVLNGVSAKIDSADISRYDMAQILYNVCQQVDKGKGVTSAENSNITDYSNVPAIYTTAVKWCYGAELLVGDNNGNFNGSNSMDRASAATVIYRLVNLSEKNDKPEVTVNPIPTTDEEIERYNEIYLVRIVGSAGADISGEIGWGGVTLPEGMKKQDNYGTPESIYWDEEIGYWAAGLDNNKQIWLGSDQWVNFSEWNQMVVKPVYVEGTEYTNKFISVSISDSRGIQYDIDFDYLTAELYRKDGTLLATNTVTGKGGDGTLSLARVECIVTKDERASLDDNFYVVVSGRTSTGVDWTSGMIPASSSGVKCDVNAR